MRAWMVAGLLWPALAGAQTNLFSHNRGSPQLTDADYKALYASVVKLTATNPPVVGETTRWRNPSSRASGSSTLAGADGACRRIAHHVSTPAKPSYDATLTWCPTPQGWKVKS